MIKMKIKNEQGIELTKNVPEELYSNYIAIGWEECSEEIKEQKEEKKEVSTFSKNIKLEKDKENENL